mgnify:CR=1 FL=1
MDIKIIDLQTHGDDRGSLVAIEEQVNIPFTIKRVYYIFDTLEGVRRGFHAHKDLKQVAIVLKGSCKFLLDNGKEKTEVLLNNPAKGLCIESMIWREMFDFSPDCILMVLANNHYDEADYIREYSEFIRVANSAT